MAPHKMSFPYNSELVDEVPMSTCRPRAVLTSGPVDHPDVQSWMDESKGAPVVWHRPTLSNGRTRRVKRGRMMYTRTSPTGYAEEWMSKDVVYPLLGLGRLIQPWYHALYLVLPAYLQSSECVIAALGVPSSSLPLQSVRQHGSNNSSSPVKDPVLPALSPQVPSPTVTDISSTDGYGDTDSITFSPSTPVQDEVSSNGPSALETISPLFRDIPDVPAWEELLVGLHDVPLNQLSLPGVVSPSGSSAVPFGVPSPTSSSGESVARPSHRLPYPPIYWENQRPVQGCGYYSGLSDHVTCLMRPVFVTRNNRLSVWGLPWRGDEEEIFPLYMTNNPPYTLYVLKPAFGWGSIWDGRLPAPATLSSHPQARVVTLYAIWHAKLGLVDCDRDLYELEQTGLLVVSSHPNELIPQDLKPAFASSLSAIDHDFRGSQLDILPLTLPSSSSTFTNYSHNSCD